ncbi:MAG: methylenetetrahydrofolate reductase, partial [Akkermansia sp.]
MQSDNLLFHQNGPSFSFEFFPPKNEESMQQLFDTVKELEQFFPNFVSVTYGAGGSTRELTREVVLRIHQETEIPAVPHLTCVGHAKDEIFAILERYADAGVRAVLALRGDPPKGKGAVGDDRSADAFQHAGELVKFIRAFNDAGRHPQGGFRIGVAGFPEGHPATPNRLLEMDYLKAKVDEGADY